MAAHVDYLKHTQENADILHEIVKHARDLRPLDSDLASSFLLKLTDQSLRAIQRKIGSHKLHIATRQPNKVEAHHRIAKSSLNNTNRVSKTVCNENVKHSVLNVNYELVCATCHECMFNAIHDLCISGYLNDVNARIKSKSMKSRSAKSKKKEMWKPIGKVYTKVGYIWKLTGQTFTIVGNICPLTRIISTNVVPPRKSISATPVKQTQPSSNKSEKPKDIKHVGSSSQSKTIGRTNRTVRFGNDQIAKIMGYGDYQLRNVTISWVFYVEGLEHNLFSMGEFCDSDLKVAFRKHTCYVRNLDGDDLISGLRDTNLYTISLDDMLKSSQIYLLSKASKTKNWLWH
ncbi:hypothetical protein Tco_1154255 [Tanacetum coccineum]